MVTTTTVTIVDGVHYVAGVGANLSAAPSGAATSL